ncbi:hypothetical protein FSO04_40775 [Paraburkholderia madseniana]|uniref:Uncharacterized protein n=1 Tax=Paraburkholderia madseniana TaxID=2599607 RepID=A0A6N6W2Y9_9BURK|nr:hypothetical protein [Paraburkholderia madseniana]KAE8754228.1 hypothetical protein FSO04_40775 [Paraburkholderia madseniana]
MVKSGRPELDVIVNVTGVLLNFARMGFGYSKKSFGNKKVPQNWHQFWDIKAFPGPRSLSSMAPGGAPLEVALIAEGVPFENFRRGEL